MICRDHFVIDFDNVAVGADQKPKAGWIRFVFLDHAIGGTGDLIGIR